VAVTHENFQRYDAWMQLIVPVLAVIISILMVSRIPYPHPLTQFLRGQRSFAQLVAIVVALMAIFGPTLQSLPHPSPGYMPRSLPQRGYIPQPRSKTRRGEVGRASGLPWVKRPINSVTLKALNNRPA
jgi:hypothetical protein